jgi:hypothetical protein
MVHIYSNSDLYNQYVLEQADEALNTNSIGDDSHRNILTAYKTSLYTPNYFIRIALALLTIVAIVFAGLLLALIFSITVADRMVILSLLATAITYVALEFLVKHKHYYNAGVDNVLMFFSAVFFTTAFAVSTYTNQSLMLTLAALFACSWLAVRFADSFMAMLAYVALLVVVFLLYIKLGSIAKATAPFVMMAVSAITYFVMERLAKNSKLLCYRACFKWVKVLTLLSFYASCNYFVVKEMSNAMFDLKIGVKDSIPFGWLFWILTMTVPLVYIVYGIRKKNLLFIRTGLVLTVISILTYRYYYSILRAEVAMLFGGCFLITVGYLLMRYLKIPKHGFVFDKTNHKSKETSALEALLLIETATQKALPDQHTQFGGGDFGGGGAGEKY